MQGIKYFILGLSLLLTQLVCAEQMPDTDDLERILTCQYYPDGEYGDALLQIDRFVKQGLVRSVKQMPRYHYQVVGELELFGFKPLYVGHTHGDFIGTFARFSETAETLVKKIEATGVELIERSSSTGVIGYMAPKRGRWQLIVMTVPKEYAGQDNPSVPYSERDSTLVQCVYQGP
jgi:hypothetical protein